MKTDESSDKIFLDSDQLHYLDDTLHQWLKDAEKMALEEILNISKDR